MPKVYGPRQTILVTSRGEINLMGKKKEIDDIITLDWHMPTSFEPFLYAISIAKSRTSYQLIRQSRCFVVNFVPYDLKKEALFCGRHSGMHVDKFKDTGLRKVDAKHIECPVIEQSCGHLECHLEAEYETGDHVIFIGRVSNSEMRSEIKRLYHIGEDEFTTTR